MDRRIFSLDLLRAFAILFVVLLHSLEFQSNVPMPTLYMFSYGWIGVDLFFVLSGFLIGGQAFNSNDEDEYPIFNFMLKRFFRTFPLYYLVLLVYVYVKPLAGHPFNDDKLKYFFFYQNFLSPRDFVQSWSLCIEEQFYILFPLLFFGFKLKKIPSYVWLLPGFLSTIFRLVHLMNGVQANHINAVAYNYEFNFFTHLDGISWGIFLASTFKTWSQFKNKKYFFITGLLLMTVTLYITGPIPLNESVVLIYQLLAISFSCILIGIYDFEKFPFKKAIQYIATWSYGIYLWNNLTARVVPRIIHIENNFLRVIVFLILTVGLSALTYYLIEKPALKLRNRVLAANKVKLATLLKWPNE